MKSLISIISINFNNLKGLKKTVSSVCEQTWIDFEYIVIDGGSTDGSAEIVLDTIDVVYKGHYISIDGESGKFLVLSVTQDVDSATVILDRGTSTANGAAAVSYYNSTWSAESEFYA